MKKFKNLLCFVLSAVMLFSVLGITANGADFVEEDDYGRLFISGVYEYSILRDGTAEITNYSGSSSNLKIPATIDGYKVTSIGWNAFGFCKSLVKITIPSSVKDISIDAFLYCKNLKSIVVKKNNKKYTSVDGVLFNKNQSQLLLYPAAKKSKVYSVPSKVKSISEYAFFDGSNNLKVINISKNVTKIGIPRYMESIFLRCSKLTEVNVNKKNKKYTSKDGVLFTKNLKNLVTYPNEKKGSKYTVPNKVKTIYSCAFYDCDNLKTVKVPNGIKRICYEAFYSCNKLTSFTVPEGLKVFGRGIFNGCKKLKTLNYNAIHAETDGKGSPNLGNCNSLTTVNIGPKVEYLMYGCFEGAEKLKKITIPKSVKTIGYSAIGYGDYQPIKNFTIYGNKNSCAKTYAKENGFKFVAI